MVSSILMITMTVMVISLIVDMIHMEAMRCV